MQIRFSTVNSSFCNPQTGEEDEFWKQYETSRVLENIITKIKDGQQQGLVFDTNGNEIGEWKL